MDTAQLPPTVAAPATRSSFVHPTAEVEPRAQLGPGTHVWNWSKIRNGARIGADCNLGQAVYVDANVIVGDRCKIQNGVSLYQGLTLGDGVFVGPNATFTNDRFPRAESTDWTLVPTRIEDGASIGANATIICGVTLGAFCMVGAGAVVTRDVPPHALVVGQPARIIDYVDRSGRRLHVGPDGLPPHAEDLLQ